MDSSGSKDGGRSWDRPSDVATGDMADWWVSDLVTDFSESSTLYVAVADKGLLSISASKPREYSVLWDSDTLETEVQSVATHPNYPGVLAIRTTEGYTSPQTAEHRGFRFTKQDIR